MVKNEVNEVGTGLIPGWGIKIPHVTRRSQKKKKKKKSFVPIVNWSRADMNRIKAEKINERVKDMLLFTC